ncbi:YdcF family protein [Synechococcus sp. N26]|uniref:YdcF family protein n=1 Tax=Synechococcus sp. N26 TaxID=2575513 RepID=UPI000E0E9A12|nr:YdcF family protein [Synechococcus sp. N26]
MACVRTGLLLGAGLMAWLLGPGPLSPYRRALLDRSPPQLVLVLGGDVDRERMGARLARQLDLPLLVSGGSNREYAEWMLSEERFNPDRVTLDYRARDTLSNFTSVVDELQADGVRHVLLVTSEDHLPRSMAVGQVVAGSRGIQLTGVPVACREDCTQEGRLKQWSDWLRAVAWVMTGRDLRDAADPDPAER